MTEEQFTKIGRLHNSIIDAEKQLKLFTDTNTWLIKFQKFNSYDDFSLDQSIKNEIVELVKSKLIERVEALKLERDNFKLTDHNRQTTELQPTK